MTTEPIPHQIDSDTQLLIDNGDIGTNQELSVVYDPSAETAGFFRRNWNKGVALISTLAVAGTAVIVLRQGGAEQDAANSENTDSPSEVTVETTLQLPAEVLESELSLEYGKGTLITTNDPSEILDLWGQNFRYATLEQREDIFRILLSPKEANETVEGYIQHGKYLAYLEGTYIDVDADKNYDVRLSLLNGDSSILYQDDKRLVVEVLREADDYNPDGTLYTDSNVAYIEFLRNPVRPENGSAVYVWQLNAIANDPTLFGINR